MGTYSEIQYDFINKEINRLNEKLHDRGIDERVYRGALRYESLGSDNSWDMRNDVGQQTRNGSAGSLHQTESEINRSGDNQESEHDTGHFSREIDAEYLSAVKRGNMETAQSDDYRNNRIINYVNSQIKKGNLLDASKTKAPMWCTTRGLQLPKAVQTIIDANNSISQNSEKSTDFREKISGGVGKASQDLDFFDFLAEESEGVTDVAEVEAREQSDRA
jgi:hypothetical protein